MSKSNFGFQVNGKPHSKGGVKVAANDAYIASKYLGVDGKKASGKNPSVAKVMLKKGGKALAKGQERSSDKFGINQWNPGAVRHHLQMMANVRDEAETGKVMQDVNKMLKDPNLSKDEKKMMLNQMLGQLEVSTQSITPAQLMSGPGI